MHHRMPADASSDDPFYPIRTRFAQPEDQPEVERLMREGLLPGHVAYESRPINDLPKRTSHNRLLVAEADGRIIGTLAILEPKRDVGDLQWLRVDPAWQDDLRVPQALARAASEHARDIGLLKLVVHVPDSAVARVAAYYHQLGFQFSRRREEGAVNVLEFYLNLYERPRIRRPPKPRAQGE